MWKSENLTQCRWLHGWGWSTRVRTRICFITANHLAAAALALRQALKRCVRVSESLESKEFSFHGWRSGKIDSKSVSPLRISSMLLHRSEHRRADSLISYPCARDEGKVLNKLWSETFWLPSSYIRILIMLLRRYIDKSPFLCFRLSSSKLEENLRLASIMHDDSIIVRRMKLEFDVRRLQSGIA